MTIQSKPDGARTVIGNISLSLDGRVTGPGGEYDMGWVVPHAMTDGVRKHMIDFMVPATTVLVGRKNYVGFQGYWPKVADDESADSRDRTVANWLNSVEKIVFAKMARIAQLVYQTGFSIANDERPVVRDNKGPRTGFGSKAEVIR